MTAATNTTDDCIEDQAQENYELVQTTLVNNGYNIDVEESYLRDNGDWEVIADDIQSNDYVGIVQYGRTDTRYKLLTRENLDEVHTEFESAYTAMMRYILNFNGGDDDGF